MRPTSLLVALALLSCGGAASPIDGSISPPDGAVAPDALAVPDAAVVDVMPPDAGPDARVSPVTLENVLALTEEGVCAWWVRCGLIPAGAACADAYHAESGTLPQLVAYAMTGNVLFDAFAADDCLTALDTVPCTRDGDELPAVCAEVFTGAVGDGGPCTVNEQCIGDSTCVQPPCEGECCVGQCTAPPDEAGIGEDCASAPCIESAWCDHTAAGGPECAARAPVGGPCSGFDACHAGAFCDFDWSTGTGACEVLAAHGASCDPTVLVPPGGCLGFDDWCNPATSVCERRKEAGLPCGGAPVDPCLAYAVCSGSTCTARPLLGQSCATPGLTCIGDLVCEAGSCAAPDPTEVCP
jgi:hypothetical protein